MAEGKYGRLFTEADVEKMLRVQHDRSWSAAMRDWDENAPAPSAEEYRPLTVTDAAGEADSLNQITGGLTFPADEPLFLLRGQDEASPDAILIDGNAGLSYYESAYRVRQRYGAIMIPVDERTDPHLLGIKAAAQGMREWQTENPDRVKMPG